MTIKGFRYMWGLSFVAFLGSLTLLFGGWYHTWELILTIAFLGIMQFAIAEIKGGKHRSR